MKHLLLLLLFTIPSISNAFVLGPTTPGKWGSPVFGTGANITYSFMGSGLDTDAGAGSSLALSSFMPIGFAAEITDAFDAWADIANLSFTQVPDPGVGFVNVGAEVVDIRITGHSFDGPLGVLAHAFFPPSNGGAAAGDMHFDSAEAWKIGLGGAGFDIFTVALHEIGHAIGLGHTAVPSSIMNPFYSEALTELQADDIAGAQYIYGAATSSVPVPAPFLLMGIGLFGIFGARKISK